MHEEATLRDLRRKLMEVAAQAGEARVTRVRLWVGALSHLSEGQLAQRWPEVVGGTPAESSVLEVTTSHDLEDGRAQGVVLLSVDVEEGKSTHDR